MGLEFDNLINEGCVPGTEGDVDVNPATCSDIPPEPPSVDDRCADPAFYAEHPELCAGYAILILKPAFALTTPGGTVQYKTYLRASGDEVEVTNGLAYAVGDVTKAIIEVDDGLLTGVAAGITTVSVTWENLTAFAQVQVVESCANQVGNFCLLIDNSQSSSVAFSSTYASRLVFAKEAASRFVESVNFSKDKVAVAYFNQSGQLVLTLTSTESDALAAIAGITSTALKTNISAGLKVAMDHLNSSSGIKCVVLFSDGENNQGDNPHLLATPWKDSGKILIGVALRAWGTYFDLMYRLASPGYFLSAYEDTEDDVIETLLGLKSYLCSADCVPAVPGTFPKAKLNYDDFTNWDVFQGAVDLIGLDQWDVQPGNGLYVDLAGTYDVANGILIEKPGGLLSKVAYSFVSGTDYRFSIDVAGNNVGRPNTDTVRVRIVSEDGLTTYLDETITPTSNSMPFTTYDFDFTAAATKSAKIKIEMVEGASSSGRNCGPLIDNVLLENLDAPATMLDDDFDDENQTVIPLSYSYYGPCLEAPPGTQAADPNPPTPPVEG